MPLLAGQKLSDAAMSASDTVMGQNGSATQNARESGQAPSAKVGLGPTCAKRDLHSTSLWLLWWRQGSSVRLHSRVGPLAVS